MSVAVLAGGASTRMGRDKALCDFDGRPLVCHIIGRLEAFSDDVFIVTKDMRPYEGLPLRVITDLADEQTPLAGILTALRTARHPFVFVCGCDMPFVSGELIRLLLSRSDGADVVVPLRDGRAESLHSLWSVDAVSQLEQALSGKDHAVHRVIERLRAVRVPEGQGRRVDPDGRSFVNVNTPDELDRAQREIA